MNEDDYRFPTKAEEHEIVKELEAFFEDIETDSHPVAVSGESLVNLIFLANPDAFGGSLENAERWLRETLEELEQQREQDESMKKILADLPANTAH